MTETQLDVLALTDAGMPVKCRCTATEYLVARHAAMARIENRQDADWWYSRAVDRWTPRRRGALDGVIGYIVTEQAAGAPPT